jgi:sensor histidine kinase YesM
MKNPFLNRNFLKLYFIVWGLIAIMQFMFLLMTGQKVFTALLQSLLSNAAFSALGFGIWFVVNYKTTSNDKLSIFLRFAMASILVVILWMGFNFVIEKLLFRISSGVIVFKRRLLLQFVVGNLLCIIMILIYHLMIVASKYTEKSNSEKRLQNLLTETRLNALKAYINPHFLFNSLNSVNALISISPEKAREMLVNLSDYFRYSLKQKDSAFVDFKEELSNALTYLEIEKLKFNDKIELSIDIEKNSDNIKVPVMILQPMFENIIKHAVSESLETIYIDLKAKIKEPYLEIILSNNFDTSSISGTGTGIGLSTNFERFNLIYKRNDLIEVNKNNNIFKVTLKIPMTINENL